jgi:hypothetical protein
VDFPLRLESSAFQSSEMSNYHGWIYTIGLLVSRGAERRYLHKAQLPRLHVRQQRQWMEKVVCDFDEKETDQDEVVIFQILHCRRLVETV